jgi:hypothetical protein
MLANAARPLVVRSSAFAGTVRGGADGSADRGGLGIVDRLRARPVRCVAEYCSQ